MLLPHVNNLVSRVHYYVRIWNIGTGIVNNYYSIYIIILYTRLTLRHVLYLYSVAVLENFSRVFISKLE
jgi:hypothetical protein